MIKKIARPDPVSEAFRQIVEDLRRDRAIGARPPQMITARGFILAILLAVAISCAGIAWINYSDAWGYLFAPFKDQQTSQ
jgi:hypothetical protein